MTMQIMPRAAVIHRILRTAGALVVLMFAVGGVARAQSPGYECDFVRPDTTNVFNVMQPVAGPHITSALIGMRVYVLVDNADTTRHWSPAQVDSQLTRLRADYEVHNIYFDIKSIGRLEVPTASYEDPVAGNGYILLEALQPSLDAVDVVLATAPSERIRPFGMTYVLPEQHGVCLVAILNTADNSVLSHEVGHAFGLYHTHDRVGCLSGNQEPTNQNCSECGDLVCDTYPVLENMSPPTEGQLWDHVDQESCTYDGYYPTETPDVDNIMAYTWPQCMERFTPGQAKRMFYFIENDPALQGLRLLPKVVFENKSSDTNLDYDGTPYSSVVLDYNADQLKDLFIAVRDYRGSLQKQEYLSQEQIPHFTDRTDYDFASGQTPQAGLRGVAVADYDNDGRSDLFASAESNPRLYHNNSGSFADSASALGLSALADSSYAGAWGDFDRDGQVDLYVCRGSGGGGDPTSVNLSAVRGKLLHNNLRASGVFVDRSDSLGSAFNTVGASVSASWADFDLDGDLDLFVGDLRDAGGSASSRLYINNGAGSMAESFASRFGDMTVENVNSVGWADMNNDAKLDLVLGSETAPPMVCFGDNTGHFDGVDPLAASLDAETNGVRTVDADLDGSQDLVALPRSTSKHRWMFWNQVVGGDRALLDQSWSVGFASSVGRIDGLAMADFNGDGDSDMYFGRPVQSTDVFYRAASPTNDEEVIDDPAGDWVGVRLVAGGGNNGNAIGATVRFYIESYFQQVQVVDGGSGKGGQADNVLICGLGEMIGTAMAQVKWPGGFVQTASLTRGQVTTITDETVPGTPSSVSGVYVALPEGQAEFRFTWDTAYSCKPSLDKVTVSDRPRQPEQCEMGTRVLTPSTDNVTHTVFAKAGGGYRHTLTWPLECRAPCTYSFTIESATDSTHKSQMAQSAQISMPVCISQ